MMSFSFECLLKLKLHFIVCSFHSFSIFFVAVVQHMEEICNKFHFFCVGFNAFIPPKKHKKEKKAPTSYDIYFIFSFIFSWNQYFFAMLENNMLIFNEYSQKFRLRQQYLEIPFTKQFFFSFASCLVGFSL